MLTEETQKIFGNLLMIISKAENSIQITRQILSKSSNYSPNYLFSLLSNSDQITDINLYNYLIGKNIPITQIIAKLIILFYDQNMDNILFFEEFIKIINNNNLMNIGFLMENNDGINQDIEFLFNKILQKEIDLCTKFISELKNLKSRNDFEIHKVFHHITNLNFINKIDLEKFLKQNNIEFLDNDINNIMRRLDINNDGVIDLEEFNFLFDFPKSTKNNYRFILCNKCKKLKNEYIKYATNKKTNLIESQNINLINKNINHNNRYNYNIEKEHISSDVQNQISNSINNSYKKNLKYYPYLNINRKNSRSYEKNDNSNNFFIKNQDFYRNLSSSINNPKVKTYRVLEINSYIYTNQNFLENFNKLLKLIMENEMEIEKEKIDFFKKIEVTFDEIYSIFDENRKGYITEKEIENGFYKIKMIDEENYEIFLNRFNINKRNRIEKEEFFDIIVPFNKKYRKLIENRIISNHLNENYNISTDKNNISYLKNLLCFIINKEKEINNYKMIFIEKNYNSELIYKIFNEIDKHKKGFFTYEDLKIYLKNYNLIFDNYAVALLFIRLDKKRKGIIELENLISEL